MDDAQKRAEQFNTEQRIAELEAQVARLRAFCDLAARWLLTLEQEHETASHQDEDTRQISSQTCHVCAGIDALWQAIKEGR